MSKPIYVLGTGLSHDGSSCLLKDGKIIVATEKERLSRRKHDGGNDSLTVQYCLDFAGISIDDLSLVVQCAHFEKDSIQKDRYSGARLFPADCKVPFVTISHHLAHAYSAVGTAPFNACNVMVIDGSGSFYEQCDDIENADLPKDLNLSRYAHAETASFYFFDGQKMQALHKDFSAIRYDHQPGEAYLPTARHSVGGLYAMASQYIFGDFHQAGKLMGLAPYGDRKKYTAELFQLNDGRVRVNDAIIQAYFTESVDDVTRSLNDHFQYYADIARWVQEEAERAILYLFRERLRSHPHRNICYAGGVALNAVTNAKIAEIPGIENFYIEPAAGDNGLAIGCAYYGWLQVLKKQKVQHTGTTFFGKEYSEDELLEAINSYEKRNPDRKVYFEKDNNYINRIAVELASMKTVAWFQLGAEFGPRALGHRSILADPAIRNIRQHINNNIKFREDFRPFAPAVLYADREIYFQKGIESPYMILIDKIKEEWREKMPGIVHVDGTCRVQTVRDKADPFYQLLSAFKAIKGYSVLLNTSFNCKAMPIIETPDEALGFFYESALDLLVVGDHIIYK